MIDPLDLAWSDWGAWSECDVTCGGGVQYRERTCEGGNVGDDGCFGPNVEAFICNTQDCQGKRL